MKTEIQPDSALMAVAKAGQPMAWRVKSGTHVDSPYLFRGLVRATRVTAKHIYVNGSEFKGDGRSSTGKSYLAVPTTEDHAANAELEAKNERARQEQAAREAKYATPEYKAASLIHGHIEHVLGTDGLSKIGLDRLNKIRDALDI